MNSKKRFLAAASVAPLFFSLASFASSACGGPGKQGTLAPAAIGSGDGGASHTSSIPSGLPPFATMPEPGVHGSNKVNLRSTDATCDLAGASAGADLHQKLQAEITCDKGLTAKGAPVDGAAGEGDPATETTFHAEKGRCYRVYTAHDLPSLVVVMKDSVGARIAESPSAATPEHARACFTDADTVTISVAGGQGKGHYAIQVVSD